MKTTWYKKVFIALGIVSLAGIAFTAFSGVTMLLWNHILPGVFHIGAITIWQAAGILLLSRILFGGFKGRGGMHNGWRKKSYS